MEFVLPPFPSLSLWFVVGAKGAWRHRCAIPLRSTLDPDHKPLRELRIGNKAGCWGKAQALVDSFVVGRHGFVSRVAQRCCPLRFVSWVCFIRCAGLGLLRSVGQLCFLGCAALLPFAFRKSALFLLCRWLMPVCC